MLRLEKYWNNLAHFGREKINGNQHGWYKVESQRTGTTDQFVVDISFNHVITMLATAYRYKWRGK